MESLGTLTTNGGRSPVELVSSIRDDVVDCIQPLVPRKVKSAAIRQSGVFVFHNEEYIRNV